MRLHFRCIRDDLMQGEVVGIPVYPQSLKFVHATVLGLLIP